MQIQINSLQEALDRINYLREQNSERIILGVVGKPGAGKSTVTSYLLDNLPEDEAVLVPMDGYHLSNKLLQKFDKANRKGASDTFDALGFRNY